MLRLFKYLKPFTPMIIAVLVFVFLKTLSDLYLPTLMSDIINKGVKQGDTGAIMQMAVLCYWLQERELFLRLYLVSYLQKLPSVWGQFCAARFLNELKAIHCKKLINLVLLP